MRKQSTLPMAIFSNKTDFLQFKRQYPLYEDSIILDTLRKKEFSRLDKEGHIYLDYTGGGMYAESQLKEHFAFLKNHTFGNPHSGNPTSKLATQKVEETRKAVLKHFNGQDDYFCVFTPNASGALKIVGECYPFGEESTYLLTLDNHNSVNGIREFAKNKGAKTQYAPLDEDTLFFNSDALDELLFKESRGHNNLFAFPAQSNVSGIKHSLSWIEKAKQKNWDVLLDAAAYVPTNLLDLKVVQPDFVAISFYKMFGFPTGLGCLLIRKEKYPKLIKPWYAGGNVQLAAAKYPGHVLQEDHERFEDGTINYLQIPAIKTGLDFMNKVGMATIQDRIKALTLFLMEELQSLSHDNGQPLIKIYGSKNIKVKGGTLVMNFYNAKGEVIPFQEVEDAATAQKISIRTGCFCNPGLDEVNHHIDVEKLAEYFSKETGNYYHMMDFLNQRRGGVRISVGMASVYKDVKAFVEFAKTYINKGL